MFWKLLTGGIMGAFVASFVVTVFPAYYLWSAFVTGFLVSMVWDVPFSLDATLIFSDVGSNGRRLIFGAEGSWRKTGAVDGKCDLTLWFGPVHLNVYSKRTSIWSVEYAPKVSGGWVYAIKNFDKWQW